MKTHAPTRLASLLAAALLTTAAAAQSTSPATPRATTDTPAAAEAGRAPKMARSDANFMKQAAQNGMAEVQSSQLALTKATDPKVKAFAQKMVDDHTKANQELMALASAKGIDVPKEPSVAQKARMKLLDTADGATFDRRYAENMGVEAHEDTLKMFRKAAAGARDADIKAFAAKTVPELEEHLKMAQALHGEMKAQKK